MKECPHCRIGRFLETDQDSYLLCDECGAIYFTYKPQPYQAAYHRDPHKIKMFAGG
jgi:uncharacterized protein (DUF983 family)